MQERFSNRNRVGMEVRCGFVFGFLLGFFVSGVLPRISYSNSSMSNFEPSICKLRDCRQLVLFFFLNPG